MIDALRRDTNALLENQGREARQVDIDPRVQHPQQAQDQLRRENNMPQPAGLPLEGRVDPNHPPRAWYLDRYEARDRRITDEYRQRARNNRGYPYQELPSSDDEPEYHIGHHYACLLYTSPSPRDA